MSEINKSLHSVAAFAPATCANVAVGFDILGFAYESIGDQVTLIKRDDKKIIIESIESSDDLPLATHKNTASIVVEQLCRTLDLNLGFSIHIKKGIPLCSGMGGSAASAVAALVACNRFLASPLSINELADFAFLGEQAVSGEGHFDNIIPCLFGGLTLIQFPKNSSGVKVHKLPIPKLYSVLVYPHLRVATQQARKVLKKEIPLKDYVQQSAKLATFIAALYENDYSLLGDSLDDLLIEPQRAQFIPGFYEIKEAALKAGALGMSFSGSGPALFAFTPTLEKAKLVRDAMCNALQKRKIASDCWISPISQKAAEVVKENHYV
ncbi:MAG: homoserine kinase [Tatlockia sp.]|nr:homoserine kinase [Tatlockia sp.]